MSDPTLLDMLLDQAGRLFDDHVDRDVLRSAEAGTWPQSLWAEASALGLPDALSIPREDGGLSFADIGALSAQFGAKAVPLPLGETILARWLLGRAGIDAPDGPIGLGDGTGYAQHLTHVVTAANGELLLHATAGAAHAPIVSISREGHAAIDLAALDPIARAAWPAGVPELEVLGAMLRASQIAGAIEKLLAMTVEYAQVRNQFGRPIGRFQAVQQLLAQLAAEVAAAQTAADAAWVSLDAGGDVAITAAIAKIRTGEAARIGAAIAHQIHGAIGVTDEHILHYYTRRLWQWRRDYGSDALWADRLGRTVLDANTDLWTFLLTRCGTPAQPARA